MCTLSDDTQHVDRVQKSFIIHYSMFLLYCSAVNQVDVGYTKSYKESHSLYVSFCVSDIFLMTADLDSRNMSCVIKDYCTRAICCVWSE